MLAYVVHKARDVRGRDRKSRKLLQNEGKTEDERRRDEILKRYNVKLGKQKVGPVIELEDSVEKVEKVTRSCGVIEIE